MKILIIQPCRYGDILQTMPVVKSIKERYPVCAIDFIIDDYFSEILEKNTMINKLIIFPKMKALAEMKYRNDFKAAKVLLKEFLASLKRERYDIVINLSFTDTAAFIAGIADGKLKTGKTVDISGHTDITGNWPGYMVFFTADRKHNPYNITDLFYLTAEEVFGLEKGGLRRHNLFFDSALSDSVKAAEFIFRNGIDCNNMAGIQVGASKSHRMLLNKKYPELIKKFSESGTDVILFGGRGEMDAAADVIKASGQDCRVFNSCGNFTIRENFAMLSKLKIFVTADTLNMHLAAAAGTPTLAIFYGGAYPYETGPYTNGAYITMPSVNCAPCTNAEKCNHEKCLNSILMEDVYNYCLKIINKEEIKMKTESAMNLYMTGVDCLSGYTLELCDGIESPDELVDRVLKELYEVFWGELFSHSSESLSARVDDIWNKNGKSFTGFADKSAVISLLKKNAMEHIEITSAAQTAINSIDRLSKAENKADKIKESEILSGLDEFFKNESEKGKILGSYYQVGGGMAKCDSNEVKKMFLNIKHISNGFTYAITCLMQKIHEQSIENNEDLIIV